jgi:cytoskeletal protein RodZ
MASLGEQLKAARESSNRSLEDVSRDTNISKPYLEALENNKFDVFPSSVYARGFLKVYAKYVGLDPGVVVSQYDKLTAFDELLSPDASPNITHKRTARRVIRKRVVMLVIVSVAIIACLVGLILERF